MQKKFAVTPKKEQSVTMTIRVDFDYNKKLEEIALKSGRSRNEIINMAIKFAIDNLEFIDEDSSIILHKMELIFLCYMTNLFLGILCIF